MNLSDELRKLQELHAQGALSADEFAAAKARVIAEDQASAAGPREPVAVQHLEQITRQNEIAELDRQWALERETYMVLGQYGHRHIPTQIGSLAGGVMIVLFGLFWTAIAFGITSRGGGNGLISLFPIFGILFIVVGAGMSIYSFGKAHQYQQAEQRYRQRRSQLQIPGRGRSGKDDGAADWG